MNEVPNFLAFLLGSACLVWVAAVISRRIDRHYAQRADSANSSTRST